MPVFKVDRERNVQVRAKIGNGHGGGIAASLGGTPVGKGNDEIVLALGKGSDCAQKTLLVTADILKGKQEPPPNILLTLFVSQPVPPVPAAEKPFSTDEDSSFFDANGEAVISLALTFL
jgi:hypothetical protein